MKLAESRNILLPKMLRVFDAIAAITGAVYLLVGGIMIQAMKGRLAKQDIVPNRSLDELRKDKQWLKNEL